MCSPAKFSTLLVCMLAVSCSGPAVKSLPDNAKLVEKAVEDERIDAPKSEAIAVSMDIIGGDAGQVRDNNILRMKFIWCPPGSVTMEIIRVKWILVGGDSQPDENEPPKIIPVNAVLTQGFWLGKYEVTQSEWQRVMTSTPWKGQDHVLEHVDGPATYVSWNEATSFCDKLTRRERSAGRLPSGWEYALPSDAQWEYACRAGTETTFSFGEDASKLDEYAWFSGNAVRWDERYAHQVGQKKPNPWGFFDMHGNICEWCRDTYSTEISGGQDPEVNLNKEPNVTRRVHRGGSWGKPASGCRSAIRYNHSPLAKVDSLGFRVCLRQSAKR